MFKDLREYIMENEFKITILKDKINIINYDRIINLTDNEVSLKIENTKIKIYGNNLMLNKLLDREVLLTGKVS
jgi:sporulation protein YqfC